MCHQNNWRKTKKRGGFCAMLFGTLSAFVLGNMLVGKDLIRTSERTLKAGENFDVPSRFN